MPAKKRTFENRKSHSRVKFEAHILDLGKLLQRLWKTTFSSNMYKKDKAEILRMLIFAFTLTAIIALFVLNHP